MFTLSSIEDKPESSQTDQNEPQKHHVRIPAFKATPTSIVRRTATTSPTTTTTTSDDGDAETAVKPKTSSIPHVPHEPYKGAVWSKPVRVRGGSTTTLSTPRSSKPPSRTASRLSVTAESVSTPCAHQCEFQCGNPRDQAFFV